uniref:NADH-ubiquinone oxidoreductase chain 5 n=1 Tax=Nepsalus jezoensis TaxID=2957737 RepID=A0A343KN67_9NEOP|nr:NADH dehydrogenase subunit 5 [Nepsalus jezoensis]URT60601.1 NADH dehydrogenase subunit 5 [Nepsalus decorillus]URT60614.1 NADH dehydrogenase subunit 5 [Nepsalus decorillus]URT60627.1 NADH dehydrogenase subunit 5 [Nepsalus decorillus]
MGLSICFISFLFLLLFSLLNFISGLYFIINDLVIFIEWEILSLNTSLVVMTILLDWMSLIFMSFVLFISSMVIYYSDDYMSGDENLLRFIILVLMFVLSMMFLIISPNLISILLGWDGLGLVSYCLVIYYQNVKSYNAGMITALTNRVGDVALLLSIAWMLNYGSWNYIYYLEVMSDDYQMVIISWLVVLAAMTKSAQIPFSSWLPAAMAAPTPVSALVHSSTLVTAGVYLLIRFNILFMNTFLSKLLLLLSVLTMFMAGLGANYEFDLKKIIALSTLSQLGLMMSILSLGYSNLAFFHLLTHALFKALLFMCAGSVIHSVNNIQDIRFMGGLINMLPLTCTCFNISNLALCGMPFLAGFYSKDLILEIVSMSGINYLIYLLYFLSTGLTVCYSFRLTYYSLTGVFNFSSISSISDSYWIMLKGMLGLLFLAIMGGSMLSWLIIPTPDMVCLSFFMKYMTLTVSLLGGLLGYEIFRFKISWNLSVIKNYNLSNFLGGMWFMPVISTSFMNYMSLSLGYTFIKTVDQGWNEYYGAQSIYKYLSKFTKMNTLLQFNNFKIYLVMFISWIGLMFMFMMY